MKIRHSLLAAGVLAIHAVDLLSSGRLLVASRNPPPGVDATRRGHRLPASVQADASAGQRVLFAPDTYYMLQNLGMIQRFDNLRAYGPMMLRRVYDLLHLAQHNRFAPWKRLPVDQNLIRVGRYRSPVLKLLGVRYVLRHNRPRAEAGKSAQLSYHVRTLPDALPRAFVVYRTTLARGSAQRQSLMRRFDPARLAVVESSAALLSSDTDVPATEATQGRRGPGGGQLTLSVNTPRPGLLVLTESWYPGWRAWVDGKPTEVHRVNHAVMGIKVPAGRHRIRLELRSGSLRWGLLVSALGLLVVLGLLLWPTIRTWRQRRSPVADPEEPQDPWTLQ